MSYRLQRVEETTTTERFYDVACDGCGKSMENGLGKHGVDEDGGWKHLEPADALRLQITSGYAGLIHDDLHELFILCESCVAVLSRAFPRIGQRLREAGENAW